MERVVPEVFKEMPMVEPSALKSVQEMMGGSTANVSKLLEISPNLDFVGNGVKAQHKTIP